jgi:hypothetical protein
MGEHVEPRSERGLFVVWSPMRRDTTRQLRDDWNQRLAERQAERTRSAVRVFLVYLATALAVFAVVSVFYFLIRGL